jgi:deazaflavin-dependent oxidoreductase (nitroreductase family)
VASLARLRRPAALLHAVPARDYARGVHLPYFLRHVNRVFTNPVLGAIAWLVPPLAVVHHVGRRSGRAYRSPVVAMGDASGYVIPMTYGRDVDWARNLLAAGGGELERMGRRVRLRNPRIVGFSEAEERLPAPVRPLFRMANLPGYVLIDAQP